MRKKALGVERNISGTHVEGHDMLVDKGVGLEVYNGKALDTNQGLHDLYAMVDMDVSVKGMPSEA